MPKCLMSHEGKCEGTLHRVNVSDMLYMYLCTFHKERDVNEDA